MPVARSLKVREPTTGITQRARGRPVHHHIAVHRTSNVVLAQFARSVGRILGLHASLYGGLTHQVFRSQNGLPQHVADDLLFLRDSTPRRDCGHQLLASRLKPLNHTPMVLEGASLLEFDDLIVQTGPRHIGYGMPDLAH